MLVEKAKAYMKQSQAGQCTTCTGLSPSSLDALFSVFAPPPGDEFDSRTIQSASAFLLNAREYAFLSGFSQPFKPGKVAPRLACALSALQEKAYMRKPTRDLFEAGECRTTSTSRLPHPSHIVVHLHVSLVVSIMSHVSHMT